MKNKKLKIDWPKKSKNAKMISKNIVLFLGLFHIIIFQEEIYFFIDYF